VTGDSGVLSRTFARWLSGESRTQKARLNAVAAVLDNGARLVVGFLVNPLLVAGLGTHAFGLWQVLRQLVGYASPAGGRPTQALKWSIARAQSSTDFDAKRQYVGATLVLWCLFLPALAVAGAAVAWYAPLWMDTPLELSRAARLAAALLVANLILTTLVEIPRATLAGENLAYKRMGLSALLIFAGGGLTALAVWLDLGLAGVAACPILTSLLTGALFLGVVRRHVAWFGVARPSRAALGAFFRLSGWFLAWRVVTQVMKASDLVVLGAFDSVEAVTVYTLTGYVPDTLVAIVLMMVSGALPGLGGVMGAGDVARARSLRGEVFCLIWLIATVCGTTMVAWNRTFVGLWVGPEHFAGALPTLLMVLMMLQFVLIRVDANIIDLTLDVGRKVVIGTLGAGLSLTFAIAALTLYDGGIVGLCLGFMAGRALLTVTYPWLVGQVLRVSLPRQLLGVARPALVTAALFLAADRMQRLALPSGWLELVLGAGLTVGLVAPLALFAGLDGRQRRQLWKRFRA